MSIPDRISVRFSNPYKFYLHELSCYYSDGCVVPNVSELIKLCIRQAYDSAFPDRTPELTFDLFRNYLSELDS